MELIPTCEILPHPADVRERFLSWGDEPSTALAHLPLILPLLVVALVVTAAATTTAAAPAVGRHAQDGGVRLLEKTAKGEVFYWCLGGGEWS
jgi:hypothetical protein